MIGETSQSNVNELSNPLVDPSSADVRKIDDDTFSILLERVKVDECWDQSREVQMGQGCISSPGGPGC